MAKWGTKSWLIEETTLHKDGSSAVLSPWKRKGKKEKEKMYYNKRYSYLVTHPSTNIIDEQGLTLLSGRNMLLSWLNAEPIFSNF